MWNKTEIVFQCFYNGTGQNEQKLSICSGYGTLLMDLLEVSIAFMYHTWRTLLSHQVKSLDIDYLKVSGTFMKSPGDPREFKLGYSLALS